VQVAIRTHYFTWINVTMIGLSIGCWLPALYGFSSIGPLQRTLTDMVELGPHLFSTPAFWLGVVFCATVMALLLDFILSSWQQQRHPLDRQIFQVMPLRLEQCRSCTELTDRGLTASNGA
jgi:magnesium-transporting ATPase (P-type)